MPSELMLMRWLTVDPWPVCADKCKQEDLGVGWLCRKSSHVIRSLGLGVSDSSLTSGRPGDWGLSRSHVTRDSATGI